MTTTALYPAHAPGTGTPEAGGMTSRELLNTLRGLVKHLESIPDDQIAGLEIPTGIPLLYELGPDLRRDDLGGQYLEPHVAVTRRIS